MTNPEVKLTFIQEHKLPPHCAVGEQHQCDLSCGEPRLTLSVSLVSLEAHVCPEH